MRFARRIAILSALLAFAAPVFAQETPAPAPVAAPTIADSPFVAKPYLQMGNPA
ncbi:MAG: hypothetical protein H7Y38_14130, partial [Armatimonadetes bacterium]|nr:hypothetical protein [Armatimonadota bacterium]